MTVRHSSWMIWRWPVVLAVLTMFWSAVGAAWAGRPLVGAVMDRTGYAIDCRCVRYGAIFTPHATCN